MSNITNILLARSSTKHMPPPFSSPSMPDRAGADLRRHISGATSQRSSKDAPGFMRPIMLLPQELLPMCGENKHVLGFGENHFNSNPTYGVGSETVKLSGISEGTHDLQKKDAFMPDMQHKKTGDLRDCWRGEERDTNSSICKDMRLEGDDEHGDIRKMDRKTEKQFTEQFGKAFKATTESRSHSSNGGTNYEQRRARWDTTWGPSGKERECLHEKRVGFGREHDIPSDKELAHHTGTGKDEARRDHCRPWISISSQCRDRREPPHHQNVTPNKQGPMVSYVRGCGEKSPSTSSLSRGAVYSRGSSVNRFSPLSQSFGEVSEKSEVIRGDPPLLKYSRTKLLDIAKTTSTRSNLELLPGIMQVSSLTTLNKSLEPMKLSAPTPEELVSLKVEDSADILSSDAPRLTKDGLIGRNPYDLSPSRRSKLVSEEDFVLVADQRMEENDENLKMGHSNNLEPSLPEEGCQIHLDNHFITEDSIPHRKACKVPAKRESSMQGNSSALGGTTWRPPSIAKHSHDGSSSTSKGLSQPQKHSNEWQNSLENSSRPKNDMKWHIGENSVIERLPPGIPNRDHESMKVVPPSPEDLVLFYKDSRDEIQGPFSGSDVIRWFEAGYFGIDLQVRIASGDNFPFSSLGNIMPHLRTKAGPPPGFGSPNLNEITDALSRPSFDSFGKSSNEVDIVKSKPISLQPLAKEAENRCVDSSSSISSTRQMFAYPRGREEASMVSKPDTVSGLPLSYSDTLSTYVNNNVTSSSNFPVKVGLESFQDSLGLYHGHNSPVPLMLGNQQQQNQSCSNNLLPQTMSNSSGILTTEKGLSYSLPRDPQLMNILQQQSSPQLHSQTAVQTQQQQLLSQVFSEHRSAQRIGEPLYELFPATTSPASKTCAELEHHRLPSSPEFLAALNMSVTNIQPDWNTNINLSPLVSQDPKMSGETFSVILPHQMLGNKQPSKKSSGTIAGPVQPSINQHPKALNVYVDDASRSSEMMQRSYYDTSTTWGFSLYPTSNEMFEERHAKSKKKDMEIPHRSFLAPPEAGGVTHLDSIENRIFVEVNDTCNNQKMSANAECDAKASLSVASVDPAVETIPCDKVHSTCLGQHEKEVLFAIPAGRSLGNFVIPKGRESTNTAPGPAWTNGSANLPKPTSSRGILIEHGWKGFSVQHQRKTETRQKSQSIITTRENSNLFSLHGSSLSNTTSQIQTSSHGSASSQGTDDLFRGAAQTSSQGTDDLFWGDADQPKLESKQVGFPQLAFSNNQGTQIAAVKGTSEGSSIRPELVSARPTEYSLTSSLDSSQLSLKGTRNSMTISEAVKFRDWCAIENVRLTGTNDTTFLEFCLTQSRSEAEILLIGNLEPFDPNHEFIHKFLHYKELLSAEVLETVFHCQVDQTMSGFGLGDVTSKSTVFEVPCPGTKPSIDEPAKAEGKKKVKKGKKVSPSMLGFNVTSNRVLQGKIQTMDY